MREILPTPALGAVLLRFYDLRAWMFKL